MDHVSEYTLGATDLAHISADAMRNQNTVIRALEADSQKDFERITESLPAQRARIQHAVDRYAGAVSRKISRRSGAFSTSTFSWPVRSSTLDAGMDGRLPDRTGSDQAESGRARRRQRRPKMIQVGLALDQLLDTVADMAKDIRDEGTKAIQRTSLLLVGGSFFVAFLNLFFTRQRGGTSRQTDSQDEPEMNPRHTPIPFPLAGDTPQPTLRPE